MPATVTFRYNQHHQLQPAPKRTDVVLVSHSLRHDAPDELSWILEGGTVPTVRRWSGHEARALRQALRMSVRAFAEHLGVAARTVSKWELRALLGLLGPATVSPLSAMLEELRRGMDDLLEVEPADRDADDWEHTVHDYSREVGMTPTLRLLPNLIADFTEIQARIVSSSGHVRTRLIHSTAQLAALTAIAFVNAGESHAAQRWWRTAARAASDTSDPILVALVRGRHAVFSLGTASTERVIGLAELTVEIGHSQPCVGVISGLAARAQALAQAGRHGEAEQALHSVIDMYVRLPSSAIDDLGSQWNWAEQRLHHVSSHVHTYAGQVSQAATAQDAALAVYPMANFQGRSQIEFHRATAFIRAGDVEMGTRHVATTLERLHP